MANVLQPQELGSWKGKGLGRMKYVPLCVVGAGLGISPRSFWRVQHVVLGLLDSWAVAWGMRAGLTCLAPKRLSLSTALP